MFTTTSFFQDPSDPGDLSNASFNNEASSNGPSQAPLTPELVHTLTLNELQEVALVYADCFANPPWNEQWSIQEAMKQIEAYLQSDADVLVIRDAGVIRGLIVGMPLTSYAGAADLDPFTQQGFEYYYIADFAVDPSMQGRGVGKSLMAALDKLAWASGVDAIITRTRTDNLAALKLFRRSGFEDQGEYEAVTGGVRSQRTVLEKCQDD